MKPVAVGLVTLAAVWIVFSLGQSTALNKPLSECLMSHKNQCD